MRFVFGLLFANYASMLHSGAGGPGPAKLYDIRSVFAETLALLSSSFTFGTASLSLKYSKRRAPLLMWLAVTLGLAAIFLGLEVHDFLSMFHKGGGPDRSGFLSAFFALVPLHGLHVTSGALWMIALIGADRGPRRRQGCEARTVTARLVLAFPRYRVGRHLLRHISWRPCMSASPPFRVRDGEAGSRERQEEYRRELRLYIWGVGLALGLTIVPFGLVNWSVMSTVGLYLAISAFVLVQIVIHFRCFLHIDPPRQNTDDLHLILFSSLLLFFMVSGTIWIMASLATRTH